MIITNTFTLLKIVSWRCIVVVFFLIAALFSSSLQAQDPDDEGELFWSDEEDTELDEDEFADEEEFLDDDDYYEDEEDEEGDYVDEEYYDANTDIDEEDELEEDLEVSSSEMTRSGWSVDISGSTARLVNHTLWKEYGLN